jgi:hypothetical protein
MMIEDQTLISMNLIEEIILTQIIKLDGVIKAKIRSLLLSL